MAGCLCPAPSVDAPQPVPPARGAAAAPPAGPGTKPTAGGRGAALKLLRLPEGRRHRAEQELLRL